MFLSGTKPFPQDSALPDGLVETSKNHLWPDTDTIPLWSSRDGEAIDRRGIGSARKILIMPGTLDVIRVVASNKTYLPGNWVRSFNSVDRVQEIRYIIAE